jgi:hypothetical protein
MLFAAGVTSPLGLTPRRCPGCAPGDLAAHLDWLSDVTSFTRGLVKSGALVLAGTEGFFSPEASGAQGSNQNNMLMLGVKTSEALGPSVAWGSRLHGRVVSTRTAREHTPQP